MKALNDCSFIGRLGKDPKKAGGNLSPQQVQRNNNNFDDDIPF